MAILRIIDDVNGKAVLIKSIPEDKEDEFLALNPNGFIKVDNLPECESGHYIVNPDGSIEVDTEEELNYLKNKVINELSNFTRDWILSQYPYDKQQADNHQAEYYGAAVILVREQLIATGVDLPHLTTTDVYNIVAKAVNDIKEKVTTISDFVSQFPEQEQFYWEQIIKAGVRKAWTVWCSQAFSEKKAEILSASSIDELTSIQSLDLPPLDEYLT